MNYHRVRFELNVLQAGRTVGKVFLDDLELQNVTRVTLDAGARQMTEVTITMYASVTGVVDGAHTNTEDDCDHGLPD